MMAMWRYCASEGNEIADSHDRISGGIDGQDKSPVASRVRFARVVR
jgi:hypothetical protein